MGVSEEIYDSWEFNVLPLTWSQECTVGIFTIATFHQEGEGFIQSPEDEECLRRFVSKIAKEYKPNPFHNFAHAIDVVHVVGRVMRIINTEAYLNEVEQFSLLVAAIGHDVGHPGVNNGFLCEVGHEVALLYNDRSCLENMHCSKLFSILAETDTELLGGMSRE